MKKFKDENLIDILVNEGKIPDLIPEKYSNIKEKGQTEFLSDHLIQSENLSEDFLVNVIGDLFSMEIINIDQIDINIDAVHIVPEDICRDNALFPFDMDERTIFIAVSNPLNLNAENEISFISGRLVYSFVAKKSNINRKIVEFYNSQKFKAFSADLDEEQKKTEETSQISGGSDLSAENSPIVRLVNSIINDSIDKGASDIHFEPSEEKLQIRFRIDGILKKIMDVPKYAIQQVISRIKIMSGLNIAESRKPQDGQAKMNHRGFLLDLRVSILPTHFGEKAVIRILDSRKSNIPLSKLGFDGENLEKINSVLEMKQGIILVTGPTGSGKTTTLYAMLNHIKSSTTNITTVEDPIEYTIEGINQVQVNEKGGITFASALRSLLRQDPDVILVGEIRDKETAEISIQASLTGHLVMSTIHTNSAIETLTRLLDIGVDRFKVSTALSAVIGQRLVRRICPDCKTEREANELEKNLFPLFKKWNINPHFYHAPGCPNCDYTGYKGRAGLYEILIVNDETREMINEGANASDIEKQLHKSGYQNFTISALRLISEGKTDFAEVSRVITFSPIVPQLSTTIDKIEASSNGDVYVSNGSGSELPRKKILVVDDDPIMRKMTSSILKNRDTFELIEASGGKDAIEKVKSLQPDLMLLDIMMPEMDGYDVCRYIRSEMKNFVLPIIMLTALDDMEDLLKGFNLGADDYVSKPIDRDVLYARVDALLRRTKK